MYHYMDYLIWRGDLTILQAPFSEVDYLIMSRLAYVLFDGAVSQDFDGPPVLLRNAAQFVIHRIEEDEERQRKEKNILLFLKQIMDSPRFGSLRLCCYADIHEEKVQEQFAAVTILLPDGSAVVAYRGTDNTLVGWKEDFNMAFAAHVPAQKDAAVYLQEVAKRHTGRLRLTGHSKGGNLAIYAGAFCGKAVQERILEIRNFDGPGFNEQVTADAAFAAIRDRTCTFLPQSSVVGMLLEHPEQSEVVFSEGIGIFQHNLSTWAVYRSTLVRAEQLSRQSRQFDSTLKEWLSHLTNGQREELIDGLFQVIGASDAKTVDELWNGKNILAILKGMIRGKDK